MGETTLTNLNVVVKKEVVRRRKHGLTYCRPERKGIGRAAKIEGSRCRECGFRIRGNNHENGFHHETAILNETPGSTKPRKRI